MKKSPDAFRTISEVAAWLETPAHVLRFWESRFPDLKPVQRAGGRRYYRPQDMMLLGGIKHLLHTEGHTIKSVQDRIKADGTDAVAAFSPPLTPAPVGAEDDVPHAPADADALTVAGMEVARQKALADDETPPIGFFFDDSEDAAPAEAQSGTFAQARAPSPPPADAVPGNVAEDAAPAAAQPMPDPSPAGPRVGTLPPLPDDPEDDAALHSPPLSLPARLRALHPDDIAASHRDTLIGLYRRLDGWQCAPR
ncbi:MerR family transcriptional regulator [Meridianimarinicoccus sp. RP-17]|uniref:MerR family transcriptional regulator n=1 Tax=Meridianimarinicoccus zhengii TaxID=2056810 RepID=UPI000DAE81B5|nr:MerR family transcriptional regulator [Phycocomes zhengii]